MKIMLTQGYVAAKMSSIGIMEWFGIDTYTKFDLEIDFDDGTKLDIEDKK